MLPATINKAHASRITVLLHLSGKMSHFYFTFWICIIKACVCIWALSIDSFYTRLMLPFLHVVFVLRDGFHIVMLKAPTHCREMGTGLPQSWQADPVLLRSWWAEEGCKMVGMSFWRLQIPRAMGNSLSPRPKASTGDGGWHRVDVELYLSWHVAVLGKAPAATPATHFWLPIVPAPALLPPHSYRNRQRSRSGCKTSQGGEKERGRFQGAEALLPAEGCMQKDTQPREGDETTFFAGGSLEWLWNWPTERWQSCLLCCLLCCPHVALKWPCR